MAYVDSLFKQGCEALMQGHADKALTFFNKVLTINEKSVDAIVWRGRCYLVLNEVDKAVVDFSRASLMDESNVDAIGFRARAFVALNNHDSARLDVERALKIDPGHPAALTARAQMDPSYATASFDYTNAIYRESQDPELYFLRGSLYEKHGNIGEAIADFQKIVQLRPNGYRDARTKLKRLIAKSDPSCASMELVSSNNSQEVSANKSALRKSRRPVANFNITDLTGRLARWLDKNLPRSLSSLRAGASDADFARLEDLIGSQLPEEFKSFYSLYDGQEEDDSLGIFFGLRPLPLEEIAREYENWISVAAQLEHDGSLSDGRLRTFPPNHVKMLSAEKWIPFTHDNWGNHIGLDLEPALKGTAGQIINFGSGAHPIFVMGKSFGEFLQRVVAELEGGNFHIDGDEDFIMKKRPAVQYFEYLYVLSGSGVWTPAD
ncbi:MAG: SMI1/KNR4 family protein [Candidatus Obscuribacterales bacterium]|nr:SMI1/KNR4 family protein [Candidatus Obscuribacterales bacterium]